MAKKETQTDQSHTQQDDALFEALGKNKPAGYGRCGERLQWRCPYSCVINLTNGDGGL